MFDSIQPQLGITTKFVDPKDPSNFEKAITDKTRMLYAETIGNPCLDVPDFDGIAKIAQKYKLPFVVDSTFATPYLFRPIERGANVVVHSLTKWIGGHGTAIGGIVVDGGNFDWTDPKFRMYNEPDKSYHDLRWARDLGEQNAVAFAFR
jgi:O-acetylhomoserine (thiol)-lyase